jgi:hypothetical protein
MKDPCKTCERTNGKHTRRCMIMHNCHRYPTLAQVKEADAEQLCRWHRFLPPAGESALGPPKGPTSEGTVDFRETILREKEIMDIIHSRIIEDGLLTDKMSKKIGW